jgi:hypothetical protein
MLIEQSLHILCFGNSLTAGWPTSHPYAISLLETLQKGLPSTVITTDVQGLPGDQVVSPPGGMILFSWSIISGIWYRIEVVQSSASTNKTSQGENIKIGDYSHFPNRSLVEDLCLSQNRLLTGRLQQVTGQEWIFYVCSTLTRV